ncbi:COX15/CtaA family protein [Kutzneria albida]|uniref:Cytochrome oxidase assembly n=1 Tax=Kutzneria albida DSM 43870 TaxID=1449976 RepID=W5W937_9PSEU|nr:COX15/CtaA family protein [Kutzneria albida]AHH97076.1 cytochrome oxidase assembly [Kutzneria albida DSM 43870]
MSLKAWIDRLPALPRRAERGLALAAVIGQVVIAVTGAVVRVTSSGLGCPTWPQCAPGSLVPIADPLEGQLHQWIEFGNRMLGGLLGVVGAACVLMALAARPRRRRVVVLAAMMPMGVVAQAVIGGMTVLAGLQWWTVAPHFLASMPLIWLSVLLYRSLDEGDEPLRPTVPRPLLHLQAAQAVVLVLLLIAGTLVTAAGPHSGDRRTPRLDVPVELLAQIHADLLFLFLGMIVALGFGLRITSGSPVLWRRYWLLVAVVLAQGAVGMIQYWTGVPALLVLGHVLGAGLVVAAGANLWTACRDRGPAPRAVTQPATDHAEPAPV